MYDCTNRTSFNNVESWVTEVDKQSGGSAIKILVATKSDALERTISTEEGQQKAKSLNMLFAETSAKAPSRVEEPFNILASEIIKQTQAELVLLIFLNFLFHNTHMNSPFLLLEVYSNKRPYFTPEEHIDDIKFVDDGKFLSDDITRKACVLGICLMRESGTSRKVPALRVSEYVDGQVELMPCESVSIAEALVKENVKKKYYHVLDDAVWRCDDAVWRCDDAVSRCDMCFQQPCRGCSVDLSEVVRVQREQVDLVRVRRVATTLRAFYDEVCFRVCFVKWVWFCVGKVDEYQAGCFNILQQVQWPVMRPVRCVSGVTYKPDFLNGSEAETILRFVDSQIWTMLLKRRVQHYGHQFLYDRLYIDKRKGVPIPSEFNFLISRLSHTLGWVPDQLTINEYLPGQGIGFHVDTHSAFHNAIAVVSLGSGLDMSFRRACGQEFARTKNHPVVKEKNNPVVPNDQNLSDSGFNDSGFNDSGFNDAGFNDSGFNDAGFVELNLRLESRSLMCFADEARYGWHHGIKNRRQDFDHMLGHPIPRERRVSLTFRQLNWTNDFQCHCKYPHLCDTQNPASLKTPDRVSA
ncbi:2OG-Fe(II) oxygenase family protein [Gregarina niphandrodes]|uniref:2OG-Fe(II) oxygenase family protein n=1 Tax=Gregarina niphandrodes TaxID=110365 RepID=A0A023B9Y9_GRENI|nr:2OG-Fe(II) oxygenase family protein [Gregarina niphandrodes]EZG76548.1 2OG-Fe(II) oxygenase family protein [Gregarina niphandrodes]|eukprot:XP_011129566.1 2OG-Fe(II) oxygenase family protein [Gregarina niphandrodes]